MGEGLYPLVGILPKGVTMGERVRRHTLCKFRGRYLPYLLSGLSGPDEGPGGRQAGLYGIGRG